MPRRSKKSPRELRRWKKRLAREAAADEAIQHERTMRMLGGPEGFAEALAAAMLHKREDEEVADEATDDGSAAVRSLLRGPS